MAGNNDFLDSVFNDIETVDAPRVRKSAKTENELTEKDELKEKSSVRDEDLKDHAHVWFKRVFSVMCIIFMIIVFVLVLHWILPDRYTWLDDRQLDNLKNIVLAVFASNAMSTWIGKIK